MSATNQSGGHNKQRWAVVTGASSGFGRAFALQLAESGHQVLLVARRQQELQRVAAEIEQRGGVAEILVADLVAPGGVDVVVRRATNLGEVDVLVNNAGFANYGPFLSQSAAREVDQIALNIGALVALTRALLPPMVARGRGQIINVASLLSFMPTPYFATYGATKAFVLAFSEALAFELRGSGVRVLATCPGPAQTEFARVAGSELVYEQLPALNPDTVARVSLRAAGSGRAVRVVGLLYVVLAFLVRLTPRFLMRRIMGRLFRSPVRTSAGKRLPVSSETK